MHILLTLLLCSTIAHANPSIQVITTLTDFSNRNMTSWSGGGGNRDKLTNDTYWPFPGREFGGADRKSIYGTRAFGSGYPYGVLDNKTISGRPFPYGAWPLYWGNNYMGSDEYGPHLDHIRPGGAVVVAPLSTTNPKWGVQPTDSYYLLGDRDSVVAIMLSMINWCQATPAWPILFDPKGVSPTIRPQHVIQYYRASSFALVHPSYNNTRALDTASPSSDSESDPLPDQLANSSFRACVDGAIANAIPILDRIPPNGTRDLVLIIIFSIFGIPLICLLFYLLSWVASCISDIRYSLRTRRRRADSEKERKATELKEILKRRTEAEQYP